MNPRRLVPSTSLLLAFEAAGRHGSFTRAAEELALTQSAVSRQVQALEELLGVALFVRVRRTIRLSEVGARYLAQVSESLERVRNATAEAAAGAERLRSLRLTLIPTFGTKYVLPLMSGLYVAHPDLLVHIHTRDHHAPPDFNREPFEAAIMPGSPSQWPDVVAHRLMPIELVVIVSPQLQQRQPLHQPQDVAGHVLLQVTAREDWARWFEAKGLPAASMRLGSSFSLTAHLIQAVAAGAGVGLLPSAIVRDEVAAGTLVTPLPPMPTERSYCLLYPPRHAQLPALRAFREYLLTHLPPG